ncbi:UNVERIFIED_CONTAM: hypothetical protein GTU68_064370 [Idotea baltica]|nr:hypothetical protein [Idotea baltica]
MAEALWRELGSGHWEADSAGSKPSGYVHPMAITAMSELDCDISEAKSSHVDEYLDRDYELVVTVCDNAKDSCPSFPKKTNTLHWPFFDPADAAGTDEEKLQVFREVRDKIKKKIADYLSAK